MKIAKKSFGLRALHRNCAIRGVWFNRGCVMVEAGNKICIEETEYELTSDNSFVIIRRKIGV